MRKFFTPEGIQELRDKIEENRSHLKGIKEDIRASTQQGTDVTHDNAGFDDGIKQEKAWSQMLQDLEGVLAEAEVINPPAVGTLVAVGRTVKIKDEVGSEQTIVIGSFITFSSKFVSYTAPLAQLIMGSKKGDVRKGLIGGKNKEFTILEVV